MINMRTTCIDKLTGFVQVTLLLAPFFINSAISAEISCPHAWVTRPNTRVEGGARLVGARLTSECQRDCTIRHDCVGFDTDGGSNCYLILDKPEYQYNESIEVTHYQLIRNVNACETCKSNTTSGSASWTEQRDMHIGGGDKSDATNFEDCLRLCNKDSECRGFDWDPKGENVCWLVRNDNAMQPSLGVNHYQKECYPKGIKIVTPPIPPSFMTSPGPTIHPYDPTQTKGPADSVYKEPYEIKPAYIVLAGLGAGCILLVIIAVVVIWVYPLKSRGGWSRKGRTKQKKAEKGELHSRQPKMYKEEHIDMNTISRQTPYNMSADTPYNQSLPDRQPAYNGGTYRQSANDVNSYNDSYKRQSMDTYNRHSNGTMNGSLANEPAYRGASDYRNTDVYNESGKPQSAGYGGWDTAASVKREGLDSMSNGYKREMEETAY